MELKEDQHRIECSRVREVCFKIFVPENHDDKINEISTNLQ